MDNEGRANGETGKNPAAAFASSAPMYTDAAFCLLLPLEALDYDAVVQGTDLIPVSVMEEWSKTEPTERKAAEEKLKGEWDHWMSAHSAMILSTVIIEKTPRATAAMATARTAGGTGFSLHRAVRKRFRHRRSRRRSVFQSRPIRVLRNRISAAPDDSGAVTEVLRGRVRGALRRLSDV